MGVYDSYNCIRATFITSEQLNETDYKWPSEDDPRPHLTASELIKLRIIYFWIQGVTVTCLSAVGK